MSRAAALAAGLALLAVAGCEAFQPPSPLASAVPLATTVFARPTADKAVAARRINDLFFFESRLYVGHGDYGVNTGRTDVLWCDPATAKCKKEFTVDDEAIDRYRSLDGKLVIPGVDAIEDWKLGNVYMRDDGKWIKHRTVPDAVHLLDILELGRTWYAAAGIFVPLPDEDHGFASGAVFTSTDEGKTWNIEYTTGSAGTTTRRIGSLAVFQGKLYAFPYSYTEIRPDQVPRALVSLLKDPYVEDGKPTYMVLVPDANGPTDVAVLDGEVWHAMDLIPTRNVCDVKATVFRDKLVMVVTAGDFVPSSKHYAAGVRLPTISKELWTYDGKQSELLPMAFDAVADVLAQPESLTLLARSGANWLVASTSDLRQWSYRALPGVVEPLSIERAGGKLYVGQTDGTILQAALPQSD